MKNIYEVFAEFEMMETRADKIDVLRRNATEPLKIVLQGAFHPDIQYVFDDVPEYKSSDAPPGLGYTSLNQEFRRLYLFVKGSKRADPNLSLERRKQILIQILESLEGREAKVLVGMIKKDLGVPGLSYKLVQEAFPGLLP